MSLACRRTLLQMDSVRLSARQRTGCRWITCQTPSILGNVKKHLKVWVTLRRPIGKVRHLLWHMSLLPSDHGSKVVMSSLLILGETVFFIILKYPTCFCQTSVGPAHGHVAQECENCGDRSMGLGQLSDDTSPGQDGMSHNSMFDSDEPSVHSSAPAASV